MSLQFDSNFCRLKKLVLWGKKKKRKEREKEIWCMSWSAILLKLSCLRGTKGGFPVPRLGCVLIFVLLWTLTLEIPGSILAKNSTYSTRVITR